MNTTELKNSQEFNFNCNENKDTSIRGVLCQDIVVLNDYQNEDSTKIVFEIMNNHISKSNKENCKKISRHEIDRFIDAYAKCDDKLYEYFIANASEDKCDQLVRALKLYTKYYSNEWKIASTRMKKERQKQLNDIKRNLDVMNKYYEEAKKHFEDLINQNLKRLCIDSYEENQIQEAKERYEMWGKYGWTIPPQARFDIFEESPVSLAYANSYMNKYVDDRGIKVLFQELRRYDNIRQEDLEEAILDFYDERYKLSAMMVFSLIDSLIICKQKHNTSVGRGGANKVITPMETSSEFQNAYFRTNYLYNVHSAFDTMFEYLEDFKEEPIILNRNCVLHGMQNKKVEKLDVIKTFLLLYNLAAHLKIDEYKKN